MDSAPSISAVTPASGNPVPGLATTVTGTNMTANTRILFEGSPATVLGVDTDGSLAIAEPPGLSGLQATVEATNPDGQSSLQSLGTAARPLFTYPQLTAAKFVTTPSTVTAGTDTLMVISGFNTHFNAQTVVGFGSSDISVRGSWLVGPNMVIPQLKRGSRRRSLARATLRWSTGLELVTQANGLRRSWRPAPIRSACAFRF